jgi:transposase
VKRLRQAFVEQVETVLAPLQKRLKFIDESGAHLGMTRRYGRAAPGQRVSEASPGPAGTHYTFMASLSFTGIEAPLIFEGTLNGDRFETYVREVLGPTLKRKDLVIMDNLAAHKQVRIREAIEARGAQVVFLPPYSPDFNPIELCWSKVKARLRQAKARTFDALVEALCEALRAVTPHDVLAWFTHCGYAVT